MTLSSASQQAAGSRLPLISQHLHGYNIIRQRSIIFGALTYRPHVEAVDQTVAVLTATPVSAVVAGVHAPVMSAMQQQQGHPQAPHLPGAAMMAPGLPHAGVAMGLPRPPPPAR